MMREPHATIPPLAANAERYDSIVVHRNDTIIASSTLIITWLLVIK